MNQLFAGIITNCWQATVAVILTVATLWCSEILLTDQYALLLLCRWLFKSCRTRKGYKLSQVHVTANKFLFL